MKLNDDVYVLPLARPMGDQVSYFNVSLILDSTYGPTLVDTGLPGQLEQIGAMLAEARLSLDDIKRVIITHQDIDHIGTLRDIYERNGATVIAEATEVPFIDGTVTPRFATPEAQARNPQMRAVAENFRPTPVDQIVNDGDQLNLAGGVTIIFTPGHTPGHMSLYLERSKTLIAGDSLTASDGQLHGPNAGATQDMEQAQRSVQKMAQFDVQTIICYHGGVVSDDANGQLQRVAQGEAA